MPKIDFVVTWVNGKDKKLQKKRNKYIRTINTYEDMTNEKSYRNWDLFRYWFRGVEKFAPWVNKVYLVVDDQIPSWINKNNPKLVIVDHKDYIPNEMLPVFNSNAIECNLYKIPNLSEYFVNFNDDMYITSKTNPVDFFKKNLPCDIAVFNPIIPSFGGTSNFQINNMEIINKYFSKKEVLKNSRVLSIKYGLDNIRTLLQMPSKSNVGFFEPHMPESLLKSTFNEVWEKEPNILKNTLKSKFRSKTDINIWLFRDWQLAKGCFYPRNFRTFGHFYSIKEVKKIREDMIKHKYKVMCINDNDIISDKLEYDAIKKGIMTSFEQILSEKSSFEK